jgi:hypothetical protein
MYMRKPFTHQSIRENHMIKQGLVISALLLLSASVANAAETTPPVTPGSQGAISVQKNLDADKSGGKADKGLTNAETHVTAKHGKAKESKEEKSEGKKERMEKAEHHDHMAKPERPSKPERPGK